ncbi:uncharacterized protein AB675_1108 [Cyphellophora attinorum]|uniref:J domain-containing protein n=1 Tax=Cyphellophora attinorum TaxID=1664694 RepID=A0A0N1HM44_9EURO|nr:uncharacterized protein AB675_1108 [Phialophora attinorum]KPI38243.1 hypothetical protein AB675_1108 [Phialophora attinorum]
MHTVGLWIWIAVISVIAILIIFPLVGLPYLLLMFFYHLKKRCWATSSVHGQFEDPYLSHSQAYVKETKSIPESADDDGAQTLVPPGGKQGTCEETSRSTPDLDAYTARARAQAERKRDDGVSVQAEAGNSSKAQSARIEYESFKRFSAIGRKANNKKRSRPTRETSTAPGQEGARVSSDDASATEQCLPAKDADADSGSSSERPTLGSSSTTEKTQISSPRTSSPKRSSSSADFWSDPWDYVKMQQQNDDNAKQGTPEELFDHSESFYGPGPQGNQSNSGSHGSPGAGPDSRQQSEHSEDGRQQQDSQQQQSPQSPAPESESISPFDPYVVLSVARTASTKQIKTAFYKLSLKNHPDKLHTSATEEERIVAKNAQQQLNRAHEILCDQILRLVYHMQGIAGLGNEAAVNVYRKGWSEYEGEQMEAWFVAGMIERSES